MSGAFSDSAFGKNTAFSDAAFDFGAAPVIEVIDTHDGERKRKRDQEHREARERLREQIRLAIDGPDAPVLIPAVARYARAGESPLEERVDISQLMAQIELTRAIEKAARERHAQIMRWDDEDNDDMEVLML